MQKLSDSLTSKPARQSSPTIAIHWLSALAVVLAFTTVWSRDFIDDDALSALLLGTHRQLGLFVLLLWFVRLLVRWSHTPPDQAQGTPLLMRWAAAGAHVMLYGVLLAMPLLGWAMTNAQGHVARLANLVPLPLLVSINPDLADTLQDWHEWTAWCLLGLILLHVLAALWHHVIRRDGVLAAMLPLVSPRSQR